MEPGFLKKGRFNEFRSNLIMLLKIEKNKRYK